MIRSCTRFIFHSECSSGPPYDPDCIGSQSILTPYYFVGDAAFRLKTYMLRPYPGKYLEDDKRIFITIVYPEEEGLLRMHLISRQ